MARISFLYDIVFVPFKNPPDTKDCFEMALRSYFSSNGLHYGVSALGGMVHTCGVVWRNERDVTLEDRTKLADWIKTQRIQCTARLGDLEEETDGTDYFRDVTEHVFEVDNLTAEERQQAAKYEENIKKLIQSNKR
jgi:hypothetical protein